MLPRNPGSSWEGVSDGRASDISEYPPILAKHFPLIRSARDTLTASRNHGGTGGEENARRDGDVLM